MSKFFCLSALLFLFFTRILVGQGIHSRLEILPAVTDIDGHGNASTVAPGDTIVLLPGQKSFLSIRFLHGTAQSPIVIINTQGVIAISGYYFGIRMDSCSHLKLSGRGVSSLNYGIKVYDIAGAGASIEGLTTDIEVEGLEISKTELTGIFAKSDPDCQFNSTRDKFTMRNLLIHDNYIHHTGMEGMYIGNTFFKGKIINCNGKDTLVYPHLLKNVQVYNNRVEHTGWDGIQVASSDSVCNIHDNYVQYDSDSAYWNQMSGIITGGGSVCDCYNNVVKDGKGDGLEFFTIGGQKIYNNLIINAGRTYHPDSLIEYQKHGIYIGHDTTIPGSSYTIVYNTIISPKNRGVKFSNLPSRNNLISNNIIINPGALAYDVENAYIDIAEPEMDVVVENNFKDKNYQAIKFLDPAQGNFDLERFSPAVNSGYTVEGITMSVDILGRSRPFDSLNDLGAFECHDSSMIGVEKLNKKEMALEIIGPNPFSDHLTIGWSVITKTRVKISLLNINGFPVRELLNEVQRPGVYQVRIRTEELPSGFYFCILETSKESIKKKIILVR